MPDATEHFDAAAGAVVLSVLARVAEGDFSARMPQEWTGVAGKVADRVNALITSNQAWATELARVSDLVGTQGQLSQRAMLGGSNTWSGSVHAVNDLIDSLVRPTIEMQRVVGAVASGDLSKQVSVDVHGDMLALKNTINGMVDQLNGLTSEVTRVAREVGTEGKLGQAAAVTIEVGGVWKDLTDNVNLMASNLTGQVRNIAEVTTAVASGDLSKKISIDVKGEFLELKNTVNGMVDQLNAFASEVTRVAREVGVEGKLGGQAQTKEIGGVWKDLTDNVNLMAGTLTGQVRAMEEVAKAVTEGDLTRQVRMEASGEVAALKDKLNEMIRNLRMTTAENVEQDWLKTNLERFTRILQGQRDLETVSTTILSELAPLVLAQHAVFYTMVDPTDGGEPMLVLQSTYGYKQRKGLSTTFGLGDGLVGQCAKEKAPILMTEVPADYVRINSGLGAATPLNVLVLPILFEGSVRAVVELASFSAFSPAHLTFLDRLTESIGLVLHTIEATTLTESLLAQSQSLAAELRVQQEELRASNADLGRQAALLAEQNVEATKRNLELEESKILVEEKAGELLLSSTYKSEFIANMSHELRTPLNSLLMLAGQLESNPDNNMSDLQVEYARVIRSSGNDLLSLLNDILDLAKVESGTISVSLTDVSVGELCNDLRSEFGPVAQVQGLDFSVDVEAGTPELLRTDIQRLRQVLKNLLANAFKFTAHGEVSVHIENCAGGWSKENSSLEKAPFVTAISISDTGIGIEAGDQQRIFEAFAQGDGTASRSYGGTGLGLSISRQLAVLLGGEISLASKAGQGSVFTVFLPGHTNPRVPEKASDASRPADEQATPAMSNPRTLEPGDSRLHPSNGTAETCDELGRGILKGKHVLVVDDDPRNLFALNALLTGADAEVTTAQSGSSALRVLSDDTDIDVDIVLMDIMMPEMDGYETIRAIRAIESKAYLPIIAVTGKVVPGERQRCLDAGASDYVPKPVNTADLLTAMNPWVQHLSKPT